jgi:hypothetical protein
VSFNYIDSHPQSTGTTKRGAKRGSSATKRMLADRTAQLDAEEDNSGEPSIWRDVYAVMRCPGPPCDKGPHCFRDPFGKKHYSLKTHLRALVNYVEQGNVLQGQDDVPEFIRDSSLLKNINDLKDSHMYNYPARLRHSRLSLSKMYCHLHIRPRLLLVQ